MSRLRQPVPRVISHISCAAKGAASLIRLMPVGPKKAVYAFLGIN